MTVRQTNVTLMQQMIAINTSSLASLSAHIPTPLHLTDLCTVASQNGTASGGVCALLSLVTLYSFASGTQRTNNGQ